MVVSRLAVAAAVARSATYLIKFLEFATGNIRSCCWLWSCSKLDAKVDDRITAEQLIKKKMCMLYQISSKQNATNGVGQQ